MVMDVMLSDADINVFSPLQPLNFFYAPVDPGYLSSSGFGAAN